MNEQENQVLRTAAERLLAVADGATLEYVFDGTEAPLAWPMMLGGDKVRIRPPAAPPSLPRPPRPTPEQVAAARMPDGRKVKPPTVCDEPGARAWFDPVVASTVLQSPCGPDDHQAYGQRRWIAEPAEDVVTPWGRSPSHYGKIVVRKDGRGWGRVEGCGPNGFIVTGWGYVTPAELLADWTHNGQPCVESRS